MVNYSATTKLLMAAVHLYPDDFKEDIRERLEHPYKAATPELGIDFNKICEELDISKGRYFRKSLYIFIIASVAIFLSLINIEGNNWATLIIALICAFLVEITHLEATKAKARNIMNLDSNNHCLDESSIKNIIISGGYRPFVGSGLEIQSWSFTVDLTQPDNKDKPIDNFSIEDIYGRIESNIKRLSVDNLLLKDQLFINGMDVNLVPHLLAEGRLNKPVDNIDCSYVKSKTNDNDKNIRHYKTAYIPLWGGRLFLNIHYRLTMINDALYSEVAFFTLPPLKQKYRNIENIPIIPTRRELFEDITKSLFIGAFSWIVVYITVFGFLQGGFISKSARLKAWKRELESSRLYNYGWDISLREKWSENTYERYFQQVDRECLLKLLTNEFLQTMRQFLSEKNISTEQFKDTTTKIVNEGVIIYGGNVRAESLATGKGATVNKK